MQKISAFTSTADGNGEFTNGSVASGVSPTALEAEWFNSVQREIISVLDAAGIELDPQNDGQLLDAMTELFAKKSDALGALAPLVGVKDKLPYFTGPKTADLADLTAAGRQLIGKTDVAAILTYLGLGEAAKRAIGTGANQVPDMNAWTSGPGWRRTPDGYIEQWGLVNAPTPDTAYPVSFPVPFPNELQNIQVSFGHRTDRWDINVDAEVLIPTRAGFTANRQDMVQRWDVPTGFIYWLAKGR